MSKVSFFVLTASISVLTGCATTTSLPTIQPTPIKSQSSTQSSTSSSIACCQSNAARFDREYANLSAEQRRLIEKHVPNSYLQQKRNSSFSAQNILDLIEYSEKLERAEIAKKKEQAEQERRRKENEERIKNSTSNKISCNLLDYFSPIDLVPVPWRPVSILTKITRITDLINNAKKTGRCK